MNPPSARSRALLSFAALLCAVACSSTNDPIAIRTGTIRGIVTDAQTLAPVSGATVSYGGVAGTSAADGSYELVSVPEGGSAVAASKPGYWNYSGWYVFNPTNDAVRNIALTPVAP